MHETQEMMQGNAVNIQECMDKTDNNSPNYGSKGWFSAEMDSWFKCLLACSVSIKEDERVQLIRSGLTLEWIRNVLNPSDYQTSIGKTT